MSRQLSGVWSHEARALLTWKLAAFAAHPETCAASAFPAEWRLHERWICRLHEIYYVPGISKRHAYCGARYHSSGMRGAFGIAEVTVPAKRCLPGAGLTGHPGWGAPSGWSAWKARRSASFFLSHCRSADRSSFSLRSHSASLSENSSCFAATTLNCAAPAPRSPQVLPGDGM